MTLDFFRQKYGYEVEGIWMPRVTAITALVSRSFAFVPQGYANWGTLVHTTIEQILKGETPKIQETILPSILAFQKWQHEEQVLTFNIEERVVDFDHGYAGTIDMIADLQGQRGVVDVKTSNGMRREYALQTAAYLNAYNTTAKKKAHTRWILRIDQYQECKGCFAQKREKSGKARFTGGEMFCNHQWASPKGETEMQELDRYQQDFQAFLAAKELWEWYYRDWLKRIENYPKKTSQKVLV